MIYTPSGAKPLPSSKWSECTSASNPMVSNSKLVLFSIEKKTYGTFPAFEVLFIILSTSSSDKYKAP